MGSELVESKRKQVDETKGLRALRDWIARYEPPDAKGEISDEKRRNAAVRFLSGEEVLDCSTQAIDAWIDRWSRPKGHRRDIIARLTGCNPEDWNTKEEREKIKAALEKSGRPS